MANELNKCHTISTWDDLNAIVEEVIVVFLSASVYACLLIDAKLMEAISRYQICVHVKSQTRFLSQFLCKFKPLELRWTIIGLDKFELVQILVIILVCFSAEFGLIISQNLPNDKSFTWFMLPYNCKFYFDNIANICWTNLFWGFSKFWLYLHIIWVTPQSLPI